MSEIWRDVSGFEGIYQVSTFGRLKSYKTVQHGRILKLTNQKGDYLRVVLQSGNNKRSTSMHRLVAETFIPNPERFPCVNHKNGDKQDNHAENLEWCTTSYNVLHSIGMHPNQTDGMLRYNKYVRPRRILQLTKDGLILNCFVNGAEASRMTGVCQRNILQVANRTEFKPGHPRKSAGGYVWMFLDEYDKEVI